MIVGAGRWTPAKLRQLKKHRNAGLEIVHLVAGRTRWEVGGHRYNLQPGDVFYTLPWEPHGGTSAREPGLVLSFVILRLRYPYSRPRDRFEFHPSVGWSPKEARRLSKTLLARQSRRLPAGQRLPWLLDQLIDLHAESSAETGPVTNSLARSAIAELASLAGSVPSTTASDPSMANSAPQRVARLIAELNTTCDQPWTLDAMAEACGMGRTRFAQLVREQTGDTPILALNRARVAMAESLLTTTSLSITTIAHRCGFSSSQYFARLFREYVGQSASDYRTMA
ncbi:MAG: AraC family transcriptional regulator [Planctomycetota bacterium]